MEKIMSDVQINNKVFLSGKVITNPVFTHEVMGEGFYEVMLAVKRMSEQEDVIPVTLSERLMIDTELKRGKADDRQRNPRRRHAVRRRAIQKLQQVRKRKKPTYADGVHKGDCGRRRRKKSQHHRTYGLRLQAHRISHDSVQARNMRRAYRGQPRLQQIRLYPVHCVGQERALCGKFGSGR